MHSHLGVLDEGVDAVLAVQLGEVARVLDAVVGERDGALVLLARGLALERAGRDPLLGVVPRAAGRRHREREHEAAAEYACHEAGHTLGAQDEANRDGHEDGEHAGQHHLLDRGGRRDLDAARRVGVEVAVHDLRERAAHQHGRRRELEADLRDDGARAAVDGEHRECREDVGQAGADEHARQHEGVGEVDDARGLRARGVLRLGKAGLLDEGGDKTDGRQRRGRDGEALARGGGRVAQGVQRVRAHAHVRLAVRHLGDAAGVVGDGAVGVRGERDSECGEEADGGDGDAVLSRELVAREDGDADADGGDSDGEHTDAEALDDDGRGPVLGGGRDVARGRVRVRRAVLSPLGDDDARDEADGDAAEELPGDGRLEEDGAAERREAERDDGGEPHAVRDDLQQHVERRRVVEVGVAHEGRADKARDDAEAVDGEGEGDAGGEQQVVLRVHVCDGAERLVVVLLGERGRERGRRDDGAGVRLEQVSAHAGDVADVVTHVVGDLRGWGVG